jgi:hypothetical protein
MPPWGKNRFRATPSYDFPPHGKKRTFLSCQNTAHFYFALTVAAIRFLPKNLSVNNADFPEGNDSSRQLEKRQIC